MNYKNQLDKRTRIVIFYFLFFLLLQRYLTVKNILTTIAKAYPAIPSIVPDGIYGPKTKAAVEKFQAVFGLTVSGVVDYNTWYEISNIYVAVTRIAELA